LLDAHPPLPLEASRVAYQKAGKALGLQNYMVLEFAMDFLGKKTAFSPLVMTFLYMVLILLLLFCRASGI